MNCSARRRRSPAATPCILRPNSTLPRTAAFRARVACGRSPQSGRTQSGGSCPGGYLHYCFDLWAKRWRRHEARGDMIVVRYADDLVAGFEHESDARRFLDAMRDRLGKFALSLHPDKTRLIEFGRFAATDRKLRGLG